jgi:hypothetical protein
VYAPIDPQRGSMEDILRSLGAVLDTRMAGAIQITQRADALVVRAMAVSGVTQRLDGCWSRLEHVLTHVDLVQLGIARAARTRAGHPAGPHEASLRVMGRLIDDRGLRGLTLMQHLSDGGWLLWHEVPGAETLALISLTYEEIQAADAALAVLPAQAPISVTGSSPLSVAARTARSTEDRSPRAWAGMAPREVLRIRRGRQLLTYAGAAGEI